MSQNFAGPPSSEQQDPDAEVQASSSLSEQTQTSLKEYGTLFEADSQAMAKVSAEDAAKLAGESFGFTAGHKADELVLGRLTVPTYGVETSDDPTQVSRVEPFIKNRLVYLVVFDDVEQPLSGPVSITTDGTIAEKELRTATAAIWVAVDAATGEVLGGESIG